MLFILTGVPTGAECHVTRRGDVATYVAPVSEAEGLIVASQARVLLHAVHPDEGSAGLYGPLGSPVQQTLADARPPDLERRLPLLTSRYPPLHVLEVR